MRIEFRDKRLERVENGSAAELATCGVPLGIIGTLRRRIAQIRAAMDERDLRNIKSLHFEKLQGAKGERSIRINGNWRLIFLTLEESHPHTIAILRVEDYH